MSKMVFKTNMHCDGCVAKVGSALEKIEGIKTWSTDLDNPDKLLIVEAEESVRIEIMKAVSEAGYRIEEKKKGIFRKWFS